MRLPKGSGPKTAMRFGMTVAAMLLSACQLGLPDMTPDIAPVNPITTGQISVTSLDAPPVGDEPATTKAQPAEIEPISADPDKAQEPTKAAAAATPVAPAVPAKSDAQTACEKGRGAWVAAGSTGTMSCQTPQRDGGKQCSRDSDCEGQCLARSRTCAPFVPLFGCNDVLQDNGQRVTLCIE